MTVGSVNMKDCWKTGNEDFPNLLKIGLLRKFYQGWQALVNGNFLYLLSSQFHFNEPSVWRCIRWYLCLQNILMNGILTSLPFTATILDFGSWNIFWNKIFCVVRLFASSLNSKFSGTGNNWSASATATDDNMPFWRCISQEWQTKETFP